MSRIINAGDTPAKRRRAHQRSCAEVIRGLALRADLADGCFDDEARDMTAFLVFSLRGIDETIEQSARAWDDRNYWKKSEKLRADWRWTRQRAADLEALMLADRWSEIPAILLDILPHFQSITVSRTMRDSDWWVGAYRALKSEARSRGAAP